MSGRLEPGRWQVGCPVCGQALPRPGACSNRWCRRRDGPSPWSSPSASTRGRSGTRCCATSTGASCGGRRSSPVSLPATSRPMRPGSRSSICSSRPRPMAARGRRGLGSGGGDCLTAPPTGGAALGAALGAVVKRIMRTPPMQGRPWSVHQEIASGPLRRSRGRPRSPAGDRCTGPRSRRRPDGRQHSPGGRQGAEAGRRTGGSRARSGPAGPWRHGRPLIRGGS